MARRDWSPPSTRAEVFEAMAQGIERSEPVASTVLRRCAVDELALALVPDEPSWDVPHRLLAGVRWLALGGESEDFEAAADPWSSFRNTLAEHEDLLADFVRSQPIQTNDVQRCWALLPVFLVVARIAGRPLELIELGASAGLNLLWDRYEYAYRAGTWGEVGSPLRLEGHERSAIPVELLRTGVDVRRRVGVDLSPIDATSAAGLRLLDAFVRREPYRGRLRQAAEVLRRDPPRLVRGDYVELLPELLRTRTPDALTVVYQTHSTVYLAQEDRARLRELVDAAGREGPLAWISMPTPEEHGQRRGDHPVELGLWPGGERRIMARTNVSAEWLEWYA